MPESLLVGLSFSAIVYDHGGTLSRHLGVTEDSVLQKMHLSYASVVSPYSRTRPHNINERLVLRPGNHFDLVNPVCPFCGSNHVINKSIMSEIQYWVSSDHKKYI